MLSPSRPAPRLAAGAPRGRVLPTAPSLGAVILAASMGVTAAPPNIIFMMADDLGYHDLACYGQDLFPTPHTDRLAQEGIRLTSAYSPASVCSPTRYAVLTGTDPCRRFITSHVLFNAEPLVIGKSEPTVASLLREAGYATGVIGKWHLGLGDTLPRDLNRPGRGPNQVGFDYSFIVPDGHNMLPRCYHENGTILGGTNPPFASRLIVQERGGKLLQHDPAGHWEDRRPNHDIGATLADKVDTFLERHAGRPFFLYYATCAVHSPYAPNPRFQGKSGLGPFGDFVMEFDWAVGRVMGKLDALGLADNTLLIVTSDNGGLGTREIKATGTAHRPSDPWRGEKGSIYEGGHRVPLLARWPGRIQPNSASDNLVSLVDLAATAAALAGCPVPPHAARDSHDMLPVLLGKETRRSSVILTARGILAVAIRQGDWKLIRWNFGQKDPELYHLGRDPRETENLLATQAERARQMQSALNEYFQRGSLRPGANAPGRSMDEILAERIERDNRVEALTNDIGETTDVSAQHPERFSRMSADIDRFELGVVMPSRQRKGERE